MRRLQSYLMDVWIILRVVFIRYVTLIMIIMFDYDGFMSALESCFIDLEGNLH